MNKREVSSEVVGLFMIRTYLSQRMQLSFMYTHSQEPTTKEIIS